MIIPSIDIMNGKAVQLKQGKEKVLEEENIMELAQTFSLYGDIAVVDLDAALGSGENIDLVKKLCRQFPCRVGGGIRTVEKARELLRAGAKKIIIGTKATPEFLSQLPRSRVIVAIDCKKGKVVDKGWTNATGKNPQDMIAELESYCSEFLFTNVDKEGMMGGIDKDIISELIGLTSNKLTVAGGITTTDDIITIENCEANAQIGMALYTNNLSLTESFLSVLNFEKSGGLIPTITQDTSGQVLMLAYSSKESLVSAFEKRQGVYFSRSRQGIWIKGETSGNVQTLVSVRYDCDRDSLLFVVKQQRAACHTGAYSCFGGCEEKRFSLEGLYAVLLDRLENPKERSYSSQLLKDEKMIMEKINEESTEVVEYRDRENLVWEIADLTYFLTALMVKKGITLNEIKNELAGRQR